MENILKNSTFHFVGHRNEGTTTLIEDCGTGFFITDNGHFLTAYHNIANRHPDFQYLYAGTMNSNNQDFSSIVFHSQWIEQDLLLGQVNRKNTPKLPVKITSGSFSNDDQCSLFGIQDSQFSKPQDHVIISNRSQNFLQSWITHDDADFEHIENSQIRPLVYLIKGLMKKGNSGGPVVDNNMNLIGIITGTSEELNVTAVIRNTVIKTFLDQSQVKIEI